MALAEGAPVALVAGCDKLGHAGTHGFAALRAPPTARPATTPRQPPQQPSSTKSTTPPPRRGPAREAPPLRVYDSPGLSHPATSATGAPSANAIREPRTPPPATTFQ